jgi:hypothetical protein
VFTDTNLNIFIDYSKLFLELFTQISILNVVLKVILAGCRWLTPVILATQDAEIRRTWFEASPSKVHKTLSQKCLTQNRVGGVSQGEGLEF